MSFSDFKLDKRIIQALDANGFVQPTLIQQKSIPKGLNRSDILGIAPTGTGKTFAFLLPAIHWLYKAKITHDDPTVLIIVPTRELVRQIEGVIHTFSKYVEIFTVGVYSGQRLGKQERALGDMIDIIVASPGRLLNFLKDNKISLKNISILILDEVDRLLDMGFSIDIEKILTYLPYKNKRQTMLFGSTLPIKVEKLARNLQKRSVLIEVARSKPPKGIIHEAFEVEKKDKFDLLVNLLKTRDISKSLIFTRTREAARITAKKLLKSGFDVEELHGGLTQRTRNHALANFESGEVRLMVATDIASRGIDFTEISHIVSFDVPENYDDYVHRAGRTGRMDEKGYSWILVSPQEFEKLEIIEIKLGFKLKKLKKLSRTSEDTSKTRQPDGTKPAKYKKKTRGKTKKFKRRKR